MRFAVFIFSALLLLLTTTAHAEFQLGDRLPVSKPDAVKPAVDSKQYRELIWENLIPDSWNPEKELQGINWDNLTDADPRAQQALERMRAVWDSAPAEPSLEGQKVRIAGFVVPLEYKGDEIHEFLLVPYFGACIHTPPPPANQIVHVFTNILPADLKSVLGSKLPADFQPMMPFWVNGTLHLDHSASDMGFSSYRMIADSVEPFDNNPKQ